MDINHLLDREQIEHACVARSPYARARAAHREMAKLHGHRRNPLQEAGPAPRPAAPQF